MSDNTINYDEQTTPYTGEITTNMLEKMLKFAEICTIFTHHTHVSREYKQ